MFEVIEKVLLNDYVSKMVIHAPMIAKKTAAGQFIIMRVNKYGERIPLTVADYNRELGNITIIYQKVGKTTLLLDSLNVGDNILDVVGPLGKPSELSGYKKAIVVGGGVGVAIAYPEAKALTENGCEVEIIAGFRSSELIILEEEMKKNSCKCDIVTDNGSNGNKGLVTDCLEKKLKHNNYDVVIAIGPLPMMKAVCEMTKKYNVKTIVSMNPIMIDGTGMCGGCRVTVDGEMKFACLDGPEFDGHKVDFDEIIVRNRTYLKEENVSREKYCNLMKGVSYVK